MFAVARENPQTGPLDDSLTELSASNKALKSSVDLLRTNIDKTKERINRIVDTKGIPKTRWMDMLGDQHMADLLRVMRVSDPRKIPRKCKLFNRKDVVALFDDVVRARAAAIWRADPGKPNDQCWYQAQDELFAV